MVPGAEVRFPSSDSRPSCAAAAQQLQGPERLAHGRWTLDSTPLTPDIKHRGSVEYSFKFCRVQLNFKVGVYHLRIMQVCAAPLQAQ